MACLALLGVPAASVAADPSDGAKAADAASAPLARGAGYGQPQGDPGVRALQRRLRALGERPGPIDGLYGPRTEAAVERLQRDTGLAVDGIVGVRTRRVLNADAPPLAPGAGSGQPAGSPLVRAVQHRLRALGERPGPLDGVYGRRTQAAIERFQRAAGQPATGVLAPATAVALTSGRSDQATRRSSDRARDNEPAQGGRPGANRGGPSDVNDQRRRAVAAPTDGTDPGELPSPILLAVLALALAAAVGVAGWLRHRRRRPDAGDAAPAQEPDGAPAQGRDVAPATGPDGAPPQGPGVAPAQGPEVAPTPAGPAADGGDKAAPPTAPAPSTQGPARPRKQKAAIGYVSLRESDAPAEQMLREQMAAIERACRQRHLVLTEVVRDVEQENQRARNRPGMQHLHQRLADGGPSCLVVARLRRLSPSVPEVGAIVRWLRRREMRFVAVDEGLDTGTKTGREAADKLVAICAGGAKRSPAVRGGQPAAVANQGKGRANIPPPGYDVSALTERIKEMRASGMTLQRIAERLNAESVPTPRGAKRWRASAVQAAARYPREGSAPSERGNGGEPDNGGGRAGNGSSGRKRRQPPRPTADREGGATR